MAHIPFYALAPIRFICEGPSHIHNSNKNQAGMGMNENRTRHRARVTAMFLAVFLAASALCVRLAYLMIFRSEYYSGMPEDLHQK